MHEMQGYQQKMPGTQATQNHVFISSSPKQNSRNMGDAAAISKGVQFLLNMMGFAFCPLFVAIRCVRARERGVLDPGPAAAFRTRVHTRRGVV
jgi:hypothetical protein